MAKVEVLFLVGIAGWGMGLLVNKTVQRLPAWLETQWAAQANAEHRVVPALPQRGPRSLGRRHRWLYCSGLAALAMICLGRFGWNIQAPVAMVFCAALVALAVIDQETGYLPDVIVMPLLWCGLMVNAWDLFVPAKTAILGAALGYLAPYLVAQIFRVIRNREGMGHGDFKLAAALGAWFGLSAVPWILAGSTLVAILVALTRIQFGNMRPDNPQPFGPYLATAGGITLFVCG